MTYRTALSWIVSGFILGQCLVAGGPLNAQNLGPTLLAPLLDKGMPSDHHMRETQGKLYPLPPPFLSGPGSVFLELVLDRGKFPEHIAKDLAGMRGELVDRKGAPRSPAISGYAGQRDYAIALSSAGLAKDARRWIEEARKLASTDAFQRREVELLRALILLRSKELVGASQSLDQACASDPDRPLAHACLHVAALAASIGGDAVEAGRTMRELRRAATAIDDDVSLLRHGDRYGPLRVAIYDLLRQRYGEAFERRGAVELEHASGAGLLAGLVRTWHLSGPTSKEALQALRTLLKKDLLHNNHARAIAYLQAYQRYGIEKYDRGVEDLTRHKVLTSRDLAAFQLMSGDTRAAEQLARRANEIARKGGDTEASVMALIETASTLDAPQSPELALRLFQEVWEWSSNRQDDLARAARYNTGLRMIQLLARKGDLRAMDLIRQETSVLGATMDAAKPNGFDGTRQRTLFVDVAVAEAMLRYAATPERLAEAERLLRAVLSRTDAYTGFSKVKPDKLSEAIRAHAKRTEAEKDDTRQGLMAAANMLHVRALPLLARVVLRQERWKEAYDLLWSSYSTLLDLHMVGGQPLEQARLALDLARAARALGDARKLDAHSQEAVAGLSIVDGRSIDLASALAYRASVYQDAGDLYGADIALRRAIRIHEALRRPNDRNLAQHLHQLAGLRLQEQDAAAALEASGKAVGQLSTLESTSWTRDERRTLDLFIELSARERTSGRQVVNELPLAMAQRMNAGEAARALEAASRRRSIRDPKLQAIVQQREELRRRQGVLDRQYQEVFATAASAVNSQVRDGLEAELRKVEQEIGRLAGRFADPALGTAQPHLEIEPTALSEMRSVLRANELLVFTYAGNSGVSTWLVARSQEPRWVRSPISVDKLREMVDALRCGLDATAWGGEGASTCRKLLATGSSKGPTVSGGKPGSLPFDLERAHDLYRTLFGEAEDLLKGPDGAWRELLVVPSGPLTGLPLHLLVTERPAARFAGSIAEFGAVKWLGTRQAVTVLPAVSSLRTLRRETRRTAASKPYIGFGNPLLLGQTSNARDTRMRALAASWGACDVAELQQMCRTSFQQAFSQNTSGRPLDAVRIREWSPVPQTACELCAIGSRLKQVDQARDIRLGRDATETLVKRLGEAASGAQRSQLQDYRILHFATHGVVSDLSKGYPEPGLILTPPDGQASDLDDGFLSASEIAGLKIDADWVILSACSTAAGSADNSEALSGLARAFFYAGARALLVSNWEVYTNAAVELTTRTLTAMEDDIRISRSEALRRAMAGMISEAATDNDMHRSHPAYWGAFMVVGENAR